MRSARPGAPPRRARERKTRSRPPRRVGRAHTLVSTTTRPDWSEVPPDQMSRATSRPRTGASPQTAKQVILQRIREAERAMMAESMSTASAGRRARAAGRRPTCSSTSARSRRPAAPGRWTASATAAQPDQGRHHRGSCRHELSRRCLRSRTASSRSAPSPASREPLETPCSRTPSAVLSARA